MLLVDDDHEFRSLMAEWLEAQGYATSQAEHGGDALAQLAAGADPDVIVLDLSMPVMSGWAFLARLRADPRHRHRRVLVASAELWGDTPDDADECLRKPFEPEQFSRTLSRLAAGDA